MSGWLIAVHCGAGRYSSSTEASYLSLIRSALTDAHDVITNSTSPPTAAQLAVRLLHSFEHSPLTNAGFGSNLTEEGRVECEASVVCGQTHLVGCCGAVTGVKEPSALALKLLEQVQGNDSTSSFAFGRQPPLVVVGEHARRLAREFGLETAAEDGDVLKKYQITAKAHEHFIKWHERFQALRGSTDDDDERLDTVGAICMDPKGNVAAALSSGGVAYKIPGRLGLAACPRMGCDASNGQFCALKCRKRKRRKQKKVKNAFAVACTGRGERFIQSALVTLLTLRLRKSTNLEQCLRKAFIEASDANGGVGVEGGVLAFVSPHEATSGLRQIQLGAAFTTPCMGVGYLQCQDDATKLQVHAQILRQPASSFVVGKKQSLSTHVSILHLDVEK
ncbi:hypothetical protein CCR75_003851 [Bremia lactucae]|uniref:Asparaginase n=1 Tax=Bremia lactucae TaxID=4779 RepID=A0A976ILC5_BRELC|nr:hypothetical protein CCR75_003851 [Bremia lactucae]